MGEMKNTYEILVGRLERKRPLGRPRCRREYNIRMDLREMGGKFWSGWIVFRTGTSGGLLWTR